MTRTRVWLSAILAIVVVLSTLFTVWQGLEPPPAPTEIRAGSPLHERLSRRVLLVVVDGLRYDVATDPARMPLFSAAMRAHSSAEIWAGRVSMTSSAVLSYGTGQHGRLEQIARNLHARAPEHNAWFANAHQAGLRLGAVGDTAWKQLYEAQLDWVRPDPDGVAIDVDFNPKTFADAREIRAKGPDFLVAHFVTPDHQGHAYGILSERYTRHIRAFDALLAEFLSEFDASWTVFVTSDHGAADSGTHGTDVPVQRRSPIYAYGPGLQAGVHLPRLEQVDLSATLPVLLGVAPPAHGSGRLIGEWLALDEATRAELACRHAERVVRYASVVAKGELDASLVSACAHTRAPSSRAAAAERAVREADRAIGEVTGVASRGVMIWLWATAGCVLLFGLALLPMSQLRAWPSVASMLLFGVLLVLFVERLPSVFPNVARVALFVVSNALLLAILLRPKLSIRALSRATPHAAALIPGALVAAYPANARPESFVITALFGVLAIFRPSFFRGNGLEPGVVAREPPFEWPRGVEVITCVVCLLLLLPVALKENGTYSVWFVAPQTRAALLTLLVTGLLTLQVLVREHADALREQRTLRQRILFTSAACAALIPPLWLRGSVGPWLGRTAWLGSAALLVWALQRGHKRTAMLLGLCSLCWVARDFEVFALLGALTLAWVIGTAWARAELSYEKVLLACLLSVALCYALRIGLQDGLEFGGLDWGAGAFNDPSVPIWVVGGALVYKYVVACALVNLALFREFSPLLQLRLMSAILLCWVVRGLALAGMFVIAGNS
ncbi:MAG TPA: alkaline phosphatase family protein, partial [Polyangiaceae bacterium]|nr:alkaline phosphatase family protein [Polyangiaceae bacterium]